MLKRLAAATAAAAVILTGAVACTPSKACAAVFVPAPRVYVPPPAPRVYVPAPRPVAPAPAPRSYTPSRPSSGTPTTVHHDSTSSWLPFWLIGSTASSGSRGCDR